MPPEVIAEFAAARKYFIPQLDTLRFLQVEVGDGADIALQELAARRDLKTIESICQQLEIRVFNRQTRGRYAARAGHTR